MPLRLVRTPLDSPATPEQALLTLRDDARPFALVGDWAGGGAVVGSAPVRVLAAGEDPLAVLDDVPAVTAGDADVAAGAVGGGWVGWLGYGTAARIERVVPPPPRPVALAEASWAFYDHVLRLDAGGRWWFEALAPADGLDERLQERCAVLGDRLAAPGARPRAFAVGAVAMRPSADGHAAAVRHCRERIAAGDLYQANLTVRLDAPFAGAAIDLFATAAARLRPARGAYVGDADAQVASLSPELFLERRGRRVRTAPIKGTVRRTGDPAERARLVASAKDAAEHVMIVDLMRNDLGRVAAYGTVEAAPEPRLEEHPGVWHLVSDVTAALRDDVGDGDLLRATFPPGSVTGAPKVKALEVIAQLESTGREVYTGAVGLCSPVAGLELNVAIRTFEVARGRVWLGAGGGVVADSDPEAEVREALVKAAPLLAAIGAAAPDETTDGAPATGETTDGAPEIAATSPGETAHGAPEISAAAPDGSATARLALPPITRLPRPDPGAGLLETLLAVDGRAVDLDFHLERLAASVREAYGERLDERALAAAIATRARGPGLQRVRAIARPGEPPSVTVAPVDPAGVMPEAPVTLVPVTVPGGAGPCKWADRVLLDHERGDRELLLCDLDGRALETGRGTLWIAEGDRLVTPPADGRILDGTVRRRLLAELEDATEEPLTLDRVKRADEILVTSSIRGVQLARVEVHPTTAVPAAQPARLGGHRATSPGPGHARVAAHVERLFGWSHDGGRLERARGLLRA